MRIESLASGRPEMRQTLDRAEKFLNLVALLAALLAAVAVAIASRDFASRHLDDCAMLRVLGLPQRTIALQYLIEFALIGVLASAVGVALGFAVHYVFIWFLAGLVDAALPPPSAWPALFGAGVGFTLLFGFGLPPVLQLARVPPLRVIRRDVGALKPASIAVLAAGAVGFAALLLAVASDLKLGLIAVGGFAGAVCVFALLSWLALGLLRRSVPEAGAPRWLVLATRQIAARPAFAVLQVSALAVGLLALVLLALLRTDLISSWRQATPRGRAEPLRHQRPAAAGRGLPAEAEGRGREPLRLVPDDPRPPGGDRRQGGRAPTSSPTTGRAAWSSASSTSATASSCRRTTRWQQGTWTPNEAGGLSVEEGLATTLGLKLGDTLRFDIGGQPAEGKITSLRKVDWSSMRVNFFVLFPTATVPEAPVSYIAAFRAPDAPGFDNAVSRDFPNITSIDVSASIAQIQGVLDQVVRAVEFLFGFTLAAGLVVLFAAVSATREARAREFAVMRALGASGRLLAQVQRAELLGVGALAGVLASVAAIAVSWALARYVFEFSWNPSPLVPLAGGVAGAVLALAAGWWGLREVLTPAGGADAAPGRRRLTESFTAPGVDSACRRVVRFVT